MKPIARWILLAFALLLAAPTLALPQDRWDNRDYYGRIDSKDSAYRAGHRDGYREGRRQGYYDQRHHLRSDNRYRGNERGFGFYGYDSRYRSQYRKGFRNGYREGYNEAYRRRW